MSETAPSQTLNAVLGLEPSTWMMSPAERLAVIGLIYLLRPKSVLELGSGDGGLTRWLAQLVPEVTTVDLNPRVRTACEGLGNVMAMCMTTTEALDQFAQEGRRFDVVMVDADHSAKGTRQDLEGALCISDIVLMHDTFHPSCRAGIEQALAGRDVYANLDLVEGGLQPDGLWGGLGLVMSALPKSSRIFVTPRYSVLPRLRRLYERQLRRKQLTKLPSVVRQRISTWMRPNGA
jgi:hypothetical protein